jgi:hypothetical protein
MKPSLLMLLALAARPLPAQMHSHGGIPALHLELTPARVATAADSARGDSLLASMRAALEPYRDVHRAEADGYRIFLPKVPQPVYHYTSWLRSIRSAWRFDPTLPGTLLYRRSPDGRWELVGAMFNAPRGASLESLDARFPIGLAQWHRHVNLCLPPRGDRARWGELRNGRPIFGPASPIATEKECRAVGGRFQASLFGWMVHVDLN